MTSLTLIPTRVGCLQVGQTIITFDTSSGIGFDTIPPGIIDKPMPLDVSNVMIVCPTCNQPTRVGVAVKEIKGETVRVRVCKRDGCGQEIGR